MDIKSVKHLFPESAYLVRYEEYPNIRNLILYSEQHQKISQLLVNL